MTTLPDSEGCLTEGALGRNTCKSLKWVAMENEEKKGDDEFSTKSIYIHVSCMDSDYGSWFVIPINDLFLKQYRGVEAFIYPRSEEELAPVEEMKDTKFSRTAVALPPDRILTLEGNRVMCYNVGDGGKGWHELASMYAPREAVSAVVVDGEVYVFGNQLDPSGYSYVEVFSPDTNTWISFAYDDMPESMSSSWVRSFPCFFEDDDKCKHILLHYYAPVVCGSIHTFDLKSGIIAFAESDFPSLFYHGAVAVDGVLYAYLEEPWWDIRAYDLVNKEWFPDRVLGLEGITCSTTHLLHLGGKRLCVMQENCIGRVSSVQLVCTVFKVQKIKQVFREGAAGAQTALVADILSSRSFILPNTHHILDCIIL